MDVGRKNCTTEVVVIKVTPQPQGSAIKTVVNIYSFDEEHFGEQCKQIKKLYYQYKARAIALDANGIGLGLVDFFVVGQEDEYGGFYPPFGVINDEEGFYKKFETEDTERNALYLIKANAPLNTEAYSYTVSQIASGKVKFLIDEGNAKTRLMATRMGQTMSPDKRADYLRPYVMTSILQEEMLNLVEKHEGINIILDRSTTAIKKDKFSAFLYGLYYAKIEEDNSKRRKKIKFSDLMFFG